MLKSLNLHGVGPAKDFGMVEFTQRLNFITGDNGLGKTFLLDIAWRVLTRTWARTSEAIPLDNVTYPRIAAVFSGVTGEQDVSIAYQDGSWSQAIGRPAIPGVVIYAGVDGNFSVWDPARNYWASRQNATEEKIRAFNFTPDEVWKGAVSDKGTQICNGLIADWVKWQRAPAEFPFAELTTVLDTLSASGTEKLIPGKPCTLGFLDETEYPTLRMPYHQDVPLIHASAGMQRIAALAYLLVWTWHGHQRASKQRKVNPAKEMIFLIDEIECHLHPQWQRRIVPALLNVMQAMTAAHIPIQLIVATHSPLVLASAEPDFDEEQDSILNIQLATNGEAYTQQVPWAKQGDVVNWLVSDIFGLRQARSLDASGHNRLAQRAGHATNYSRCTLARTTRKRSLLAPLDRPHRSQSRSLRLI